MRAIYNLAFLIFGIFYLPYLVITKRYKYGMADRFGFLSSRLKTIVSKNRIIWIHAVSVGEMKTASILAPLLRKAFPSHVLLFSSVTHTGNKIARTIAAGNEEVFYLPFDLSFIMDKVVMAIKPEIFISLETELWPNLISSLHRFNAKIVLVNGRISNRSYFGYQKIRFVISRLLKKFSLILMQSEKDAIKILTLGAPKDKVFVTGNLKFDLSLLGSTNKRREIREKLGIKEEETLLIAGSTHRGEEEQILDCFSKLKNEYANLGLLIAPRHIERIQEIENLLVKKNFKSMRVSSLSAYGETSPAIAGGHPSPFPPMARPRQLLLAGTLRPVYLLDTIGDLKTMYSASDIVFMGGSLVKKGGQNPIEPASLSRPVIFGKFTFNFQDVVRSFIENKACIQVENKDELYSAIRFLLDSPRERKRLGINAKEVVDKNSGSSHRTMDLILSLF